MKSLFVEVTGQHDNIGDSLLRRGLLDAVRHPDIQLHVMVGDRTSNYVSGLGVTAADVIYRERDAWIRAMAENRGHGATSYIANPGEVTRVRGLRYPGAKLMASLMPLRMRGGALLHTGVGIRDVTSRRWVARTSPIRFFDLVTWRDPNSRDFAGIGEVQPDWGFATGEPSPFSPSPRSVLAVSVRGDREVPSDRWVEAVKRAASKLDLEIVTFSQVVRDSDLALELGRRLGADEVVVWESEDHAAQEARVRALFGRSAAVVSDRVHGLIAGATEGAYPLGMPPKPNEKSIRTLRPAGFPRYIPTVEHLDAVVDRLTEVDLQAETQDAVQAARAELAMRAHQIREAVLSR